jgi:hypothetical protein
MHGIEKRIVISAFGFRSSKLTQLPRLGLYDIERLGLCGIEDSPRPVTFHYDARRTRTVSLFLRIRKLFATETSTKVLFFPHIFQRITGDQPLQTLSPAS